jgi:hypothetical protein
MTRVISRLYRFPQSQTKQHGKTRKKTKNQTDSMKNLILKKGYADEVSIEAGSIQSTASFAAAQNSTLITSRYTSVIS